MHAKFLVESGVFWVSKQRLVDQTNTVCKNSLMIELQIEELERNLAENDSYKEKGRNVDDAVSNLGEEVRDILTASKADQETAILLKKRLPLLKKQLRCQKKDRKRSYQLLEIYPSRRYQRKMLRLINVCVNLNYKALQIIKDYFMQELLLLQIVWD